jgi:hypothetical protein
MSIEIVFYPESATKEELCRLLIINGFRRCQHLWNWPQGSAHFAWFEPSDFKSIDGVEATVYVPSDDERRPAGETCAWALHTRTRASASSHDKNQQNVIVRLARKEFGGSFVNDWHGKNRYTPVQMGETGPVGRGIFLAYEHVTQSIHAVKHSLPEPRVQLSREADAAIRDLMERSDPVRVLYNALVPFAVAAIERFFGQVFRILLRYDSEAKQRLPEQKTKVPIDDVLAISSGEKTIEDVVADWYSFQNIQSSHKAFSDWFGIDLWGLLRRRKRVGARLPMLERQLNRIIEFRHGVIHRLELDLDLGREEIEAIFDVTLAVVETFIDHLEKEKGFKIRSSNH